MLHLILADAELETVPSNIAFHRIIRWHAKKRGRRPTELLLDSSLHYQAMRGIPEGDRRGRPDIVHACLLLALDTPLNREGLLRVYVHTRQNKVISVDPSANLPRAYHRFVGLMEQLFLTGDVPPENPLLHVENASLAELIGRIKPKRTITFSEHGERKLCKRLFGSVSPDEEVCVIIGAFPRGDFLSKVAEISDELVSIDPDPLRAPTVVARVIYAYEESIGIQELRLKR